MATSPIRSVRGLSLFKKKAKVIKDLIAATGAPEIHGDKVWFSSYFVMDWLDANPPQAGSRVMDIGCGWGPLAIYCARQFKADVTAVDADENVFPLLELHAEINQVHIRQKVCRYEDLKKKTLAKQKLIVGADICFWKELVDPLYRVIKKALAEGVEQIIIADPGRSPFLKLAKKCQQEFGASLQEVSITEPRSEEGYLLVISQTEKDRN